jgi:flagellar biosynthetic protein FliO
MGNGNGALYFGLIVVFALLGGAWYLSKRLNGAAMFNRQSKYMKTIDRLMISREKWIELVQIGDQIYVLGISNQTMETLAVITEQQLEVMQQQQTMESFKTVFERIINKRNKEEK